MSKRLLLTSVLLLSTLVPAYADNDYITDESTCNEDTLGSTESATLTAQWSPISYSEPAGQYLLYDSVNETITQHQSCAANYYCTGFTNQPFNDASMGLTACSTLDNGAYPYSATGASSSAYCYNTTTTTCAAKNPYYYGHGTANYATNGSVNCNVYAETPSNNEMSGGNICTLNTVANCAITSLNCNTGYSSTGTNGVLAAYVNENAPNDDQFIRYKSNNGTNTRGDQTGLSNGSWSVKWMDNTTVSGIASCNTNGGAAAYIDDNGNSVLNGTMTPEAFFTGFSAVATPTQVERLMTLFTQYTSNQMTFDEFRMRGVKEFGVDQSANYNTSSTGQYCWCKMTNYSLLGGATQSASNSYWAFDYMYNSAESCANNCASDCSTAIKRYAYLRNAIFGALGANMECVANTVSLDWDPANGDAHTNSTCTYDQGITLPDEPTKAGYTFAGWQVVTQAPTP